MSRLFPKDIKNSIIQNTMRKEYDVIVIGAGHAGCEAALASARIGAVSYTHLTLPTNREV